MPAEAQGVRVDALEAVHRAALVASVAAAVEAHGGSIRAESALGEGTQMIIELPSPA